VIFSKRLKRYLINRKLKKLNKALVGAQDIKSYLVLENQRLDLITKLNKIGKKNDK
jgi:hypothetical protein